ncbi:iron-containing alcohol dehydrogenase [Clostridium sp. 19966]|uniref:iron-containing alcohol dehydrogenase n=1 Tax=Clostridium sp. 19966 TaxID=2768166 RepID=UPI0028E076CB|nr:iron-containing alcohol dehydrogenase [Clostridium sp. 19966]MDT8718590.1 iron-containing alcohol dehydrogenase [Clostridium sp. 19966]
MKLFALKPQIHTFCNFQEFVESFKVDENDLFITELSVFRKKLTNFSKDWNCIFLNKFSSSKEAYDSISLDISNYDYKRIIAVGDSRVFNVARNLASQKGLELILLPDVCDVGNTTIGYKEFGAYSSMDKLNSNHIVLIPEFLKGTSSRTFIIASINTLINAMESYLSVNSSSYTELFSESAIKTVLSGLRRLLDIGKDNFSELLEDFFIASNYAEIAISNTGFCSINALSRPLMEKYHVVPSECYYEFFTDVFKKYNSKNSSGKIKFLNNIIGEFLGIRNDELIYDNLQILFNKLMPRKRGRTYGMTLEDVQAFTKTAYYDYRYLFNNSYISLSYQDILSIYKKIF